MERISWNYSVRKTKYDRVQEDRNNLDTIKRRNTNWTGHILHRNCFLKHITEGKMKVGTEETGWQGRRCKQLLENLRKWEDTESRSIILHFVENLLWNRLWTCHKTDYRLNARMNEGLDYNPLLRSSIWFFYTFPYNSAMFEVMTVHFKMAHIRSTGMTYDSRS
jgi:hypothetical protein